MRLCGIRLLVALLTFGAGVAASSLWVLVRAPIADSEVPAPSPGLVAPQPASELPPPPPRPFSPMKGHFFVEGGVLDGKVVSKPQPVYPASAGAARVKGTVVVWVRVDVDGRVISAVARSGPAALREAAEEAALKATLPPTRLSGEPVPVTGTLTYNFGLE